MTNSDTNDVAALVPDMTLNDTPRGSEQESSQVNGGESGARERWEVYEDDIRNWPPGVSAQEMARREALYYYHEHYVASLMGDRKTGFGVVDQQELVNEDSRLHAEKWDSQDFEDHWYWDSWDYCNYDAIDRWLNKYQTYDPYMPFEFEGIGQNLFRAKLEEENGWELYALDHIGLRDVHRHVDELLAQERREE